MKNATAPSAWGKKVAFGFIGGKPRLIMSFEDFSLSPEQNQYSVDFLTIIFVFIAFITTFYIGTWVDTQTELAFKAGLLMGIMAISLAAMGFFGWLISASTAHDMIYVFDTEISGKAISTGFIVFSFLIIGQLFVFTGLPAFPSFYEISAVLVAMVWLLWGETPADNARMKAYISGGILAGATFLTIYFVAEHIPSLFIGIPLSSISYSQAYSVGSLPSLFGFINPAAAEKLTALSGVTINPSPQLTALFYSTSAIAESFALQGFEYSMLMVGLANFDPDNFTWKNHIIASLVTVMTAGLLHFAVYQLVWTTLIAVMLGFAIINLSYELTDALNVAIVAHLSLNIISTVSGSALIPTGSALAIVPLAAFTPILAVLPFLAIPAFVLIWRRTFIFERIRLLRGLKPLIGAS